MAAIKLSEDAAGHTSLFVHQGEGMTIKRTNNRTGIMTMFPISAEELDVIAQQWPSKREDWSTAAAPYAKPVTPSRGGSRASPAPASSPSSKPGRGGLL